MPLATVPLATAIALTCPRPTVAVHHPCAARWFTSSDDAAPEPRREKEFDAPFNAACASVTDHDARSFATTVSVPQRIASPARVDPRPRDGSRTFGRLSRVDLMVRNRVTRDVTRFAVTTKPDAADMPRPVKICYPPKFGVVVELRLDDQADVPRDPADVERC